MSFEDLPNEFDIIILGTGMTTTITAAAFSRIGLKVLHLDRNDYYGGQFANFNLDAIEKWKERNRDLIKVMGEDKPQEKKVQGSIPEDLKAIDLPHETAQAFNLTSSFHIRERTLEEEESAKKKQNPFKVPFFIPSTSSEDSTAVPEDKEALKCSGSNDDPLEKEPDSIVNFSNEGLDAIISADQGKSQEENEGESETVKAASKLEGLENTKLTVEDVSIDNTPNLMEAKQCPSLTQIKAKERSASKLSEESKDSETAQSKALESSEETKKEWTVGDIKDDWRRFCLDLSPKVLFCCGEIIELLIRSDVARYCEFRTVSRVLTLLKGKLESVPCSRADVFGSKIVSLIEKRLMMKFLQFAADFDNHPDEYEGHKDSPFNEFLKHKKLTPNLQHFVQHAIAMVDDAANTEYGLTRTKKFLQSLGRYGNTAFLFPLYGTGELSQAFARMSAVFGGVYCLMETATHLLADAENNCSGIITSKGQKINCKYLVAEASYLPSTYTNRLSSGKTSRGIYITDSSLSPSSDEDLTLLNFICEKDSSRSVTVLEMPPSACVCPKDLFVVYLTRTSHSDDPEEDLREVRERLFASRDCASHEDESRPRILWSMHFSLYDWSEVELTEAAVKNVLVVSEGGDAAIDLDKCVPEAKKLFYQVCPDEEFLPTPPNPEDIIHVDDTESPVVTGTNSEFDSTAENLGEKSEVDVDPGEATCQKDEWEASKGAQDAESNRDNLMNKAEEVDKAVEKESSLSKAFNQENES